MEGYFTGNNLAISTSSMFVPFTVELVEGAKEDEEEDDGVDEEVGVRNEVEDEEEEEDDDEEDEEEDEEDDDEVDKVEKDVEFLLNGLIVSEGVYSEGGPSPSISSKRTPTFPFFFFPFLSFLSFSLILSIILL